MRASAAEERLMRIAIDEARRALSSGDVPVGAVVAGPEGEVIARGRNEREASGDPTGHAEVIALREAARRLGGWRLDGCTLVVTLEPCVMCAGALLVARIPRLVFGAWDEKAGGAGSVYDLPRDPWLPMRAEVIAGVLEAECAALLRGFFRGAGESAPARSVRAADDDSLGRDVLPGTAREIRFDEDRGA